MKRATRSHHPRRRKTYRNRLYFDMLRPNAFIPSGLCSPLERTSTSSRTAKTPRYKARHCAGKARLGRDSRTLYVSVVRRRKIAYSSRYRMSYSWKMVYDRRTNKKFNVHQLPEWVVLQIS